MTCAACRLQGALWGEADSRRSTAIDALNHRHGSDIVAYASAGVIKGWTLRSAHLFQRYTTVWSDVLYM